jgi:hypothetical protein
MKCINGEDTPLKRLFTGYRIINNISERLPDANENIPSKRKRNVIHFIRTFAPFTPHFRL